MARTEEQSADLFLAAVTQQMLIYACRSVFNSTRVDAGFARLLSSADDAVVQMAVAAYAQARSRGPLARAAATRLLADAHDGLVRRYLSYLPRVRHDVLASVLDELEIIWNRVSADTGTRVEVLDVLRDLAARDPHEVMAFVEDRRSDWLSWFIALPRGEARRCRQAPLGLVEALAVVDEEWAAGRLLDIARVVTDGATTQDALAPVLAVGARVLTAGRHLRALMGTVPPSIGIADSGIGPLKLAMAGLHRRVWLAEGRDPIQLVPEIMGIDSGSELEESESDSEVKESDSDASIVMRRTRLWALAERAHSADPAVVRALLDAVLACREPRAQSDVVDYFLRPLLEGEHRRPVPGAPEPTPGAIADLARDRCAAAIDALDRSAAKTDGGRDVATLWRDSLDHADVPPAVVADLVRRAPATAMAGSKRWLSPTDLAALVVPAAFGGYLPAKNALHNWARRQVPAQDELCRRIIAWRLGRLAVEHSDAVSLLISDTKIENDATYLVRAVQQPGVLRAEHADALLDTARLLLASRTPDVRRDAYRLLVALVPTRRAGHRTVIDAVASERGIGALNAAINLLEAELHDSGAQPWTSAEFARLESALKRLAGSVEQVSEAPTTEIAGRAQVCLRLLYCRHGALEPETVRHHVLDRIRSLTLGSNEQEALAPVGFFMSRLAAVDPSTAADFLVEASVHVQGLPGGSWRARRGHRWRPGIADVVARSPHVRWRQLMRELTAGDADILIQAVDISINSRKGNPAAYLEGVLTGERVLAEFRNSCARRQRIEGGSVTWMAVLDAWRAVNLR